MDYSEVVKRLKAAGDYTVFVRRGKGSHRIIALRDADGQYRLSYPLPYHGNKTPIKPGMLRDIRRKFSLPRDFFD